MIKIVKKEIKIEESLISRLKSKIEDLKALINYWKDQFQRVVKYIRDKIHGILGYKDNKYKEIADNLFITGIMDEKNILL